MDAGAEQSLTARTFPPAVRIHSRRKELSSFLASEAGTRIRSVRDSVYPCWRRFWANASMYVRFRNRTLY